MNKNEFIRELRKQLEKENISDIDEIINDFEEHFEFRMEEGKTEEEIVKKIGNPKDIAIDYTNQSMKKEKTKKSIAAAAGLVFLDIFLSPIFIFLWASVIAMGVLSITLLTLGFCLALSINIANLIPNMPYVTSILFGISMFGLSISSFIGTFYMFQYMKQWGKVFFRWQENILNKFIYPSLSMHPKISKRISSKLKLINMITIVIFIAFMMVGFIYSMISSGSLGFWHAWGWFQ